MHVADASRGTYAKSGGYGLIGATALVYVGIAVSKMARHNTLQKYQLLTYAQGVQSHIHASDISCHNHAPRITRGPDL